MLRVSGFVVKRLFLPLLCAVLLGLAQFGALTHAVWHAHAPGLITTAAAQQHGHDQPAQRAQGDLCAFHAVFGQVLGGAASAPSQLVVGDANVAFVPDYHHPRRDRDVVPAVSRGPPRDA